MGSEHQPGTPAAPAVPTGPVGYLTPEGVHHACAPFGHAALAATLLPGELDPERVAEERGWVRIEGAPHEHTDRRPALQWTGGYYRDDARVTEAQLTWLRTHGYGRLVRELLPMWHAVDFAVDLVSPDGAEGL